MSLAQAIETQADKVDSGIGENVSVISMIDTYLRTRPSFRPFKVEILRSNLIGFHPSGLAGACPRQISFGFIHEKGKFRKVTVTEDLFENTDNLAYLERIFDNGHMIHSLIYSYLEGYKETIDPNLQMKIEVAVKGLLAQFLVGGTADILIKLQDGKWYFIDVKSCNSNVFNKLKTVNDISKQYRTQASLYGMGLGTMHLGNLFWNKDTGKMKEFFYKRDDELLRPALITALTGKKWLSGQIDNIPILEECLMAAGKYNSCDYASICFSCNNKSELLKLTTAKSHTLLVN